MDYFEKHKFTPDAREQLVTNIFVILSKPPVPLLLNDDITFNINLVYLNIGSKVDSPSLLPESKYQRNHELPAFVINQFLRPFDNFSQSLIEYISDTKHNNKHITTLYIKQVVILVDSHYEDCDVSKCEGIQYSLKELKELKALKDAGLIDSFDNDNNTQLTLITHETLNDTSIKIISTLNFIKINKNATDDDIDYIINNVNKQHPGVLINVMATCTPYICKQLYESYLDNPQLQPFLKVSKPECFYSDKDDALFLMCDNTIAIDKPVIRFLNSSDDISAYKKELKDVSEFCQISRNTIIAMNKLFIHNMKWHFVVITSFFSYFLIKPAFQDMTFDTLKKLFLVCNPESDLCKNYITSSSASSSASASSDNAKTWVEYVLCWINSHYHTEFAQFMKQLIFKSEYINPDTLVIEILFDIVYNLSNEYNTYCINININMDINMELDDYYKPIELKKYNKDIKGIKNIRDIKDIRDIRDIRDIKDIMRNWLEQHKHIV